MKASLYLEALRAAHGRQLSARLLRPVSRRRFPAGAPPGPAGAVDAAAALWRSEAFEPGPAPDPATRLGVFHLHYGEDVLAAARRGDPRRARQLVERWISSNPPGT